MENNHSLKDRGHVPSPGGAGVPSWCACVVCRLTCALSSAILLYCAFPPVLFFPLAWAALVPLLFLLDQLNTRRAAFFWAYVTGFLFFLFVLQWIHFVTTPGLILLASYLALYFGMFGLFYRWTARFKKGMRLFLIPAGWVVLEYVRATFLTGFNWGSLGHSQAEWAELIAISGVTGVAGVSFVVVYANVFLKEMICAEIGKKPWKKDLLGAIVVCALVLLLGIFTRSPSEPLSRERKQVRVAFIQPNVSLAEVWSPALKPEVVRRQIAMSRDVLKDKPDLIVWPETSFPHFIWELPELFEEVKSFARDNEVSLLIGAVTKEEGQFFNSALLIWPNGEVLKTYSKRHLVLFGEYIPFREELPFLSDIVPIDDFTPGAEDSVFELPSGIKFSVLICFEDTIPSLARRDVHNGADFLVNMTNDAWFRDSGQPRMHLYNALFRSAENRRPLIRATNTGESCLIREDGHIGLCVQDPAGRKTLVTGSQVTDVVLPSVRTPYTKYGEIFTFLCFLGILGTLLVSHFYDGGGSPWGHQRRS